MACLQFLDFCFNRAEDVCPKRIRVALAVEVSGCFCSGYSLPTSSALVAKLRALDPGPCIVYWAGVSSGSPLSVCVLARRDA